MIESFLTFINKIPFYGLAVLCIDDAHVRGLVAQSAKTLHDLWPFAGSRFLRAGFDNECRRRRIHRHSIAASRWGNCACALPGRHSATNALAAVAVAHELEIPFAHVAEALAAFTGIHRRFEVKGEPRGVMVIDDYGHHPTEIRATIGAIRDSWKRPLTVIFQPHRFTRTQDLFDEFLTAFEGADRLVLTEIYAAGEDPIAGATGEALYQAIKRRAI